MNGRPESGAGKAIKPTNPGQQVGGNAQQCAGVDRSVHTHTHTHKSLCQPGMHRRTHAAQTPALHHQAAAHTHTSYSPTTDNATDTNYKKAHGRKLYERVECNATTTCTGHTSVSKATESSSIVV